jgi:hypothetical protein
MIRWLLVAALVVAGCGDDAPELDDAGCGDLPDPSAAWIRTYQQQIVGKLTGHVEVAPGTRLADRHGAANRKAARTYLGAALSALGLEPELDSYGTGVNVHARLDATESGVEETLVVGAHYDTVKGSPGANDNATGVAAVLAVARYLSGVRCRSYNVLFVLFDEEELGQLGSRNLAKRLHEDKTPIVSVHTIDQLGWDQDGDRAMELERPDTGLLALYRQAVTLGGFSIPLTVTQTGGTDHVAFRAYGFPAVGLTEEFATGDTTPHYHAPTDTYATVSFDYLASSTALVSYTMAGLLRGTLP